MEITDVVLAGDILELANVKLAEIRELILAGLGVLGLAAVGKVWWATKALVPVVIAALVAGFALWVAANLTEVRDKVETELGAPGLTRPLDPAAGLS